MKKKKNERNDSYIIASNVVGFSCISNRMLYDTNSKFYSLYRRKFRAYGRNCPIEACRRNANALPVPVLWADREYKSFERSRSVSETDFNVIHLKHILCIMAHYNVYNGRLWWLTNRFVHQWAKKCNTHSTDRLRWARRKNEASQKWRALVWLQAHCLYELFIQHDEPDCSPYSNRITNAGKMNAIYKLCLHRINIKWQRNHFKHFNNNNLLHYFLFCHFEIINIKICYL